jgi:hypothetical protein
MKGKKCNLDHFRHLDDMVLQFEGVAKFFKQMGWDQKDLWLGETASGNISISCRMLSLQFKQFLGRHRYYTSQDGYKI